MRKNIPDGYKRASGRELIWLKKRYLDEAYIREVRIGYGPQNFYYFPSARFSEIPPINEKRSAAASAVAQRKRDALFARIKGQKVCVNLQKDLETLAKKAIKHRNHWRSYYIDRNGYPTEEREGFEEFKYFAGCENEPHVRRWMLNFLRHSSNYHDILNNLHGKTGCENAYELLKNRINKAAESEITRLEMLNSGLTGPANRTGNVGKEARYTLMQKPLLWQVGFLNPAGTRRTNILVGAHTEEDAMNAAKKIFNREGHPDWKPLEGAEPLQCFITDNEVGKVIPYYKAAESGAEPESERKATAD